MAQRTVDPIYFPFAPVTPAGTGIATPQAVDVPAPRGVLEAIDLQIPPGHHGQTGLRVALAGVVILPYSLPANWIIGDNLQETFVIGVEIDTQLRVQTYNKGVFDHTHYLRFRIRQIPIPAGVPQAQLLPASAIGGA